MISLATRFLKLRRKTLVAAPPAQPIRLSATLGFRPQNGFYEDAGSAGQTFCSRYEIEAPATRVRLFWFNHEQDAWTVDAAAVAQTSGTTGALSPLDVDGRENPGAWRRVTFPGADPHRLTLAGDGGPAGVPALGVSDWIDIDPVARRDGGPGALLLVRCFSRGQIRFSPGGPPDPALGRSWAGAWCVGDAASPPFAMEASHALDFVHACYGLQYETATPGATVMGIGDSIMQSFSTTNGVSGFGARACATLSTPALPVSYFNEAYAGRRSADYAADGMRSIELIRPQVALIQAWSENDPWAREEARGAYDLAMRLVDAVRKVGGAPILVTAAPVFGNRPSVEVFRRESNERVRASGLPVLDLDRLWGDGTRPTGYRPEYDSGDATHPNDAAAIVAAEALLPMLRSIIAG